MAERIYEFNWDIIGDLQEGRPNLGDQVNVVLYRVMQQTFQQAAAKRFGKEETAKLFFEAGNIAGRFFFEHFLKDHKDKPVEEFTAELMCLVKEFGAGILNVEKTDTGLRLTTVKDLAVLWLSGLGSEFSEYDAGFVTGVFFKYSGQEFPCQHTWQEGRGDLGGNINLIPYRMLQYTVRDVIEQSAGTEECDRLFYDAGTIAGHFFFDGFLAGYKEQSLNGFIAELQRILKELGVGILRVEKADSEKGEFTLTVSEDLDCSGLPDLGIEVCNYDEGFSAGIFYKFTGVQFKATNHL
jgi:predicted hydrocarbon binding protein